MQDKEIFVQLKFSVFLELVVQWIVTFTSVTQYEEVFLSFLTDSC